jgi:uncharacterized membrane-anchored protein
VTTRNATEIRPTLPPNHPMRQRLNDEVHARPPERIITPARVKFLALIADAKQRQAAWAMVTAAAERCGAPAPEADGYHYSADFGAYRVKAELHTEFLRLKIIAPGYGRGGAANPFLESPGEGADIGWLADLPGETICAIHAAVMSVRSWPPSPDQFADWIAPRDALVGATISGGAGAAFTDLRIRDDGFERLLILDRGLSPGQVGRNLQRLVEMDTYRMLALLAFPIARRRMGELTAIEQELAGATSALVSAKEEQEPGLLERLTDLAARMENLQAGSQFRFAAAGSYYELVERRIEELREERIEGLQTFREFVERRLAPAMRTCRAVTDREETLSARISRATELLSTRVELSSQRQSHALLDSMDRRAQLQLRLQETVEGLSVAAITYYIVSLVGKAAEGLEVEGVKIDPALAMGVAIPFVAALVAFAGWRMRRSVAKAFEKHS